MQSLLKRGGSQIGRRPNLVQQLTPWWKAAETFASITEPQPLEKEFLVYRWSPEDGGKPRYDSYKVDLNRCACGRPDWMDACTDWMIVWSRQ